MSWSFCSPNENWLTRFCSYSALVATGRGWSSHENTHHQVHYYQQHGNGNMDLYSLLAGLSFASLLGATIIFLARRNSKSGKCETLVKL